MKIKVDGTEYELPRATLGELRAIKREFGVILNDESDLRDPDVAGSLAYIAMHRADNSVTVAAVDAIASIEFVDDEDEGPTEAAPAAKAKPARTKAKPSK